MVPQFIFSIVMGNCRKYYSCTMRFKIALSTIIFKMLIILTTEDDATEQKVQSPSIIPKDSPSSLESSKNESVPNVPDLDIEKKTADLIPETTILSPSYNSNSIENDFIITKIAEAPKPPSEENFFLDPKLPTEPEQVGNENKFVTRYSDAVVDHVEFIQLRLKHIAQRTSDNITELRELQLKEFEANKIYKQGWTRALEGFNKWGRKNIFQNVTDNATLLLLPDEYHIAVMTFTLGWPTVYSDFGKKTMEICSEKDIDDYQYKSYFKLLLLAIRELEKFPTFQRNDRFLYRGVTSRFKLEAGEIVSFQRFVSTSVRLGVSEGFAGKTLFEFQGPFHCAATFVKYHSYFPSEQEVLFSPFNVYIVDSVHDGSYYTRYVLKAYNGYSLVGEDCDESKRSSPGVLTLKIPTTESLQSQTASITISSSQWTKQPPITIFWIFCILLLA